MSDIFAKISVIFFLTLFNVLSVYWLFRTGRQAYVAYRRRNIYRLRVSGSYFILSALGAILWILITARLLSETDYRPSHSFLGNLFSAVIFYFLWGRTIYIILSTSVSLIKNIRKSGEIKKWIPNIALALIIVAILLWLRWTITMH